MTGRAIVRARVRLSGTLDKGPLLTDESGRFEFDALPRGMYSVIADKSTYLSGRFPDTGRSVRNRNRQFELADGQRADDISVAMFRAGVIAGRVLDMYGDPVDGVNVTLVNLPRNGRPQPRGGTMANDLGEFRIARVEPGRYVVRARPQGNFQSPTGAQNAKPLPQPLPVYYPGVVSADQAQVIVVNRGETITGIDFMLTEGLPTVVSGMVIANDGQPVKAGSVSVRSAASSEYGYSTEGGTGIRPDGTFRFQVPPGDYMFEARGQPTGVPVSPERSEIDLTGSVRVAVSGESIEGVLIPLGNSATASGRIIFEGTSPLPATPRANTRVPFYSPDGPGCRSGVVTVEPDWSFKAEGLSGTCAAPPMAMFGRWMLKALTVENQNLLDKSVTFQPGQHYTNVRIVVTDKRIAADFKVTDDAGQPSRDFVLIVFPADKEKWAQLSRYVRFLSMSSGARPPGIQLPTQVRAANLDRPPTPRDNVVRLPSLQPGEHYAVAVDDIDSEDLNDPAVMEKLTAVSVRFTASDDTPVEVPLRRVVLADIIR